MLIGFSVPAPALPNGRLPDVFRFNRKGDEIFIGDAKETETPGIAATRARLYSYCKSLAEYLAVGGNEGVLAICFGNANDTSGWLEALKLLCAEAGLRVVRVSHTSFAPRLHIVCFRLISAMRMH